MKNADEIIPEYQQLKVGDSIPMHPKMGSPYKVAEIVPGRALVLQIREDTRTGEYFEPDEGYPEKYQNMSWTFLLNESEKGTTRLISRSRNDWNDNFGNKLFFSLFGPVTLMMDRKFMLGIKKRAESKSGRTRD